MNMVKPILCAIALGCLLVTGCESTGEGTQEAKRRAAMERYQQSNVDEAQANLWHAHESVLDRDNNPLRAY